MAVWIDFRELREQLDAAAVLAFYKVDLKSKRGNQHQGFCPLPGHSGKRRSPSFSMNLDRRIFHCFGCGAKGNLIDFCCLMENKDPNVPADVREVAEKLVQAFGIETPKRSKPRGDAGSSHVAPSAVERKASRPVSSKPARAAAEARNPTVGLKTPLDDAANESVKTDLTVIVNPPLEFTLNHLDAEHPYLHDRGLTTETIAKFGLGFASRGMLKDRIAIPIHNDAGELVGYAGRIVDDELIGEDCPKYLFPGAREKGRQRIEFHKSELLYNLHRLQGGDDLDLVVCEGFASVWHLDQCGFPNSVALMGSDCSDVQLRFIRERCGDEGTVWLFPDDDRAGEKLATSLAPRIAEFCKTRWIRGERHQPTDYTTDELEILLKSVRH